MGFSVAYTVVVSPAEGMVTGPVYEEYPDFSTVTDWWGVPVVYTGMEREPPDITPLYSPSRYTEAPLTLQSTRIHPSSPPRADTPGMENIRNRVMQAVMANDLIVCLIWGKVGADTIKHFDRSGSYGRFPEQRGDLGPGIVLSPDPERPVVPLHGYRIEPPEQTGQFIL
jgi:hypothetical protein